MSGCTWRAPKLITGSGAAASTTLARGGRPASRLGEDAQERGLVQAEVAVARADAQHDLLGLHAIAVAERLDHRLVRLAVPQHVGQQTLTSSMPHSTASRRQKTSITTIGSMPSLARISSARAKYTSADSPDRMSRDGARRIPGMTGFGEVM